MLRITKEVRPPSRAALVVEGQLVGPWVEELRRATEDVLATGNAVLDLQGLRFADREGVALLRRLRDAGLEMVGSSTFVTTLIGGGP